MLQLNGFSTEITGSSLSVLKAKVAPADVRATRRSLGDSWFTMYHEGHLYSLAKIQDASGGVGETDLLVLSDHLGLRFVKTMLDQAMRGVFHKYDPVRDRPFTFLSRNVDLVELAASKLESKPGLLSKFEIRPKYELEAKLVEFRPGELELMLTLNVTTRWICNASIKELTDAMVPVRGMHLIRKRTEPGQRRLVGTFDRLDGDDELTGNVREKLQGYLLHRGWPDDETFERSLASFPIYRREFKKCRIVLEALERADGHKELVDLTDGIQIEHVMPQKLPGGAAGKSWREMLGDRYKKVHDRWLHTIGNLTLTGYNQTLSNRAFGEKKKELCESKLTLNKIFERTNQWGEKQITERAAALCPQVSKLWPRPSSDIEYTPPTKKTDGTNKVRERRKQYWAALTEMLDGSGVSLRPVRKCEVRTCDFFLPMADVNLSCSHVRARLRIAGDDATSAAVE